MTSPLVDEEFPSDPNDPNFPKSWTVFVQAPGSTDDTLALQEAIDTLAIQNCGATPCHNTLFLPRGDYTISSTIFLKTRGVRIIGADPAATIIHWRGVAYDTKAEIAAGRMGIWHGIDQDSMWGFDNTAYPDVVEPTPGNPAKHPQAWMFLLDNAGAGEMKRLTLDGGGHAEVAIRVANKLHNSPTTQCRFTDLVIMDTARGIYAGFYDLATGKSVNDDEGYILRTRFVRIGKAHSLGQGLPPGAAQAGVLLAAQETFNWDIQDSSFEDCDAGIVAFSGGFNAWHNVFLGSRVTDLYLAGSGGRFEARDNSSRGSWRFALTDGMSGDGSSDGINSKGNYVPLADPSGQNNQAAGQYKPIILANNVVLQPTWVAIDLRAISAMVIDNNLETGSIAHGSLAPIQFTLAQGYKSNGTFSPNDLTFIGNAFSRPDTTALSPLDNTWWKGSLQVGQWADPSPPNHLVQFSNATWSGPPAMAVAAAVPQYQGRPVIEITPATSTATINQLLLNSMPMAKRPMFHFQAGTYYLDRTIVIPAGFDGILAGDGVATQLFPDYLHYAGLPAGKTYVDLPPGSTFPMFKLLAPARVTVRDLSVITPGKTVPLPADPTRPQVRAFVINSFDTFGDQTYLRQVIAAASNSDIAIKNAVLLDTFSRSLMVDGLDAHLVRADKSSFGQANIGIVVRGSSAAPPSQAGVKINGGSAGLTLRSLLRVERNGVIVEQGSEHESVLGYDLSNDGGANGAWGNVTLAGSSNLVANTSPLVSQYGDLNAKGFQGQLTVLEKNSDMHVNRGGTVHPADATLLLNYVFENHTSIAPWEEGNAPVFVPKNAPNAPISCTPIQSIASQFLAKQDRAYTRPSDGFGLKDCTDLNAIGGTVETSYMALLLRDFRASRVQPWTRTCQAGLADAVFDRVFVEFFDPVGNIVSNGQTEYGGAIHLRRVTAATNQ